MNLVNSPRELPRRTCSLPSVRCVVCVEESTICRSGEAVETDCQEGSTFLWTLLVELQGDQAPPKLYPGYWSVTCQPSSSFIYDEA